ncbi:MAG: DUF1801 domain-containing protein [Phycisphaerales bacterium]|nr:DUF1801 domain-containing protein [Phycisphaerales bacterium]
MKRPRDSATGASARRGGDELSAYADGLASPFGAMCNTLRALIEAALPGATSKVWHGSPVWFIDGNPVVGYNATAKSVNLLLWNGQALDEPELKPVGKYGAAQAVFAGPDEIDGRAIRRWLKKAGANVFDSKAFFKKLREKRRTRP